MLQNLSFLLLLPLSFLIINKVPKCSLNGSCSAQWGWARAVTVAQTRVWDSSPCGIHGMAFGDTCDRSAPVPALLTTQVICCYEYLRRVTVYCTELNTLS